MASKATKRKAERWVVRWARRESADEENNKKGWIAERIKHDLEREQVQEQENKRKEKEMLYLHVWS